MRNRDATIHAPEQADLNISAEGLRGKQSVRTTFRLPPHVIELLGIVAAQLNLKQKSLFDQLIEDVGVLDKVAERAHGYAPASPERRQKTFVLSRRSLEVLEQVASRQNIPRDVLVEISIRRLLPVMTAEQEKHRKRTELLRDLKVYYEQGKKVRQKAEMLVGGDDPVVAMVAEVVATCGEKVAELEDIVRKGQSLEGFTADERKS